MTQKKWLDGYSGQSTRELISFEKDHRVDSLVLAFEQAIQQRAARDGESSLTLDERLVLAIEGLEREVNNGGYSQFFVNSSRKYAPIILESLQAIGCPKTAEITREAIGALHIDKATEAEIESRMEKGDPERDSVLRRCDKEYFKCSEPIAERLYTYIRTHQQSFPL